MILLNEIDWIVEIVVDEVLQTICGKIFLTSYRGGRLMFASWIVHHAGKWG